MKEEIKKILSDFLYDMNIHNPPNVSPQQDLIEHDFEKTTEKLLALIAPSGKNICSYCKWNGSGHKCVDCDNETDYGNFEGKP